MRSDSGLLCDEAVVAVLVVVAPDADVAHEDAHDLRVLESRAEEGFAFGHDVHVSDHDVSELGPTRVFRGSKERSFPEFARVREITRFFSRGTPA